MWLLRTFGDIARYATFSGTGDCLLVRFTFYSLQTKHEIVRLALHWRDCSSFRSRLGDNADTINAGRRTRNCYASSGAGEGDNAAPLGQNKRNAADKNIKPKPLAAYLCCTTAMRFAFDLSVNATICSSHCRRLRTFILHSARRHSQRRPVCNFTYCKRGNLESI